MPLAWRIIWIVALVAAMFVGYVAYMRYSAPTPPPPLKPLEHQISRIVIEKADRRMTLYSGEDAVRTYQIALGFAPAGDKQQEGDGKTPEGVFKINRKNPNSSYHLSLGIDYPQQEDRDRAAQLGVSPGGDIFIHGQPNGIGGLTTMTHDWTAGCIAVSDAEVAEIWAVTDIGTEVEIRP